MLRRSVVPAGTLPRRNPPPFPHLKSIPKIFKSNQRYPYTTLLLLFPKTSLDSKNEESFWEGLRSQFHPKPLFYRQAKGGILGKRSKNRKRDVMYRTIVLSGSDLEADGFIVNFEF